jgi:hypothetical protein
MAVLQAEDYTGGASDRFRGRNLAAGGNGIGAIVPRGGEGAGHRRQFGNQVE